MRPIESSDTAKLEELLMVNRVLERLRKESVQDVLGPMPGEGALERNMKANGGKLSRKLRSREGLGRQAKKSRKQIAAEAKERRRRRSDYYHNQRVPRRTEWSVQQVKEHGAGGWWDVCRRRSASSWAVKADWTIGKEEWEQAMQDSLEDVVPVLIRYNSKQPWTLDNIYIVNSESRAVVFDGKEHKLRMLGFII